MFRSSTFDVISCVHRYTCKKEGKSNNAAAAHSISATDNIHRRGRVEHPRYNLVCHGKDNGGNISWRKEQGGAERTKKVLQNGKLDKLPILLNNKADIKQIRRLILFFNFATFLGLLVQPPTHSANRRRGRAISRNRFSARSTFHSDTF